jgi:hypothetical protein
MFLFCLKPVVAVCILSRFNSNFFTRSKRMLCYLYCCQISSPRCTVEPVCMSHKVVYSVALGSLWTHIYRRKHCWRCSGPHGIVTVRSRRDEKVRSLFLQKHNTVRYTLHPTSKLLFHSKYCCSLINTDSSTIFKNVVVSLFLCIYLENSNLCEELIQYCAIL